MSGRYSESIPSVNVKSENRASGLGVIVLSNNNSTASGIAGVGVMEGVFEIAGVKVTEGVSVIVGERVIEGVRVIVGVREKVAVGGWNR